MWVVRRRQGTPEENADQLRQGGRRQCQCCRGMLKRSNTQQATRVDTHGRQSGGTGCFGGLFRRRRLATYSHAAQPLPDDSLSKDMTFSDEVVPSAGLITVVNEVPPVVVQEPMVYEATPQPTSLPAMGEVQIATMPPVEMLLPAGSDESKEQYVPGNVMVSLSQEEAVRPQLEQPVSPAPVVVMEAPQQAVAAQGISPSGYGSQFSARPVYPIRQVSSPSGARQGQPTVMTTSPINMGIQVPQTQQRLQVPTPQGTAISPGLRQPGVVYMGQTRKPPSPANIVSPVMMMPGTPPGRIVVQQPNSPQSRPGSVLVQDGAKPVQLFRPVQPGSPMRTVTSTIVQGSIRTPSIHSP